MPTKNAPPRGWVWELEDGSIYRLGRPQWRGPDDGMLRGGAPSSATAVSVRIVPEGRYRELLKAKRDLEAEILVELVGKSRRAVIAEAAEIIAIADWGTAHARKRAEQWLADTAPAAEEGEGEA